VSSSASTDRRAVVVRGGWPGHVPVEGTDEFIPFLEKAGFTVETHDSLDVYLDAGRLAGTDLIVQSWTMGEISDDQLAGLTAAVRAGTGFAGWHGGIVDSFRAQIGYCWLTGGQFMSHPDGQVDYEVVIEPDKRDNPIVAGFDRIAIHTEQYWVVSDGANDVLATTTFQPRDGGEWAVPVTVPVIWTRQWGAGKVFVNTVGHNVADLQQPAIRATIERGLLWASR
jgi:uncharacterized protein